MNIYRLSWVPARFSLWLIIPLLWVCHEAGAQTEITGVNPANGASGVSTTASVTFSFNDFMDSELTSAQFFDVSSPLVPLPVAQSWSMGDTILTCTPTVPFPSGTMIIWIVQGESLAGDPLEGTTSGFFSTGGGGGTGSGTNQITEFSVGKSHGYLQTSTAAPSPRPDSPYGFSATTTLASNRTADAVMLTLPPSGPVISLTRNPLRSEHFYFTEAFTNQSDLEAKYQSGNYIFDVQSAANQQVTVNLSASLVQPGAPFINNFTAAQTINATQDFRLGWSTFSGGTASDYIFVQVLGPGGILFQTPNPGTAGALNGTATSVLIPANTLQPGSSYTAEVGFYRLSLNTNNPTYSTAAFRATFTEVSIATTGGQPQLVLASAALQGNGFAFDITSAPGKFFIVEWANAPNGPWNTLTSTSSPPSGLVHILDARSRTNRMFFRAHD